MTQGERIKELRKERLQMTLEQFGGRLGVSKVAISRIENNVNSLTDQMAKAICREYNVREEWLKDGIGEPFVKLDREEELMAALGKVMASEPDSFRRRWMAVFAQLTEAEWDTLESIFFRLFDAKKED